MERFISNADPGDENDGHKNEVKPKGLIEQIKENSQQLTELREKAVFPSNGPAVLYADPKGIFIVSDGVRKIELDEVPALIEWLKSL